MKISTTGEEVTIIEFSKAELESCRLTYENITRNVVKSKTAIYKIISETAKMSGNDKVISENTLIDILPDGEGGCIIILNNTPIKKPLSRRKIYTAKKLDGFFDLARSVSINGKVKSSLYKRDNEYFLAVEGEQSIFYVCSEFLSLYSDELCDEERLRECGELLIENNALEILCGTASEK